MEQEKHIENTKLDGSLKPNISLIAKNINKVNASIIVRLDKKINNCLLFTRSISNTQRHRKVESKNMGKVLLWNTDQKEAGVAILVSFKRL